MSGVPSGREQIVARVRERAKHVTEEQVQTTCSFAQAERLFGREYHGRFLIELLQNAADAWRKMAPGGERSTVAIVLEADTPALVVANHGAEFSAKVVLDSLGHIGRSTKVQGEAIGHKGIGFKSVLELSAEPELYSGLQCAEPLLAVRFDAVDALNLIRSESPGWDELVAATEGAGHNPLDAVPVLRYPRWVNTPPATIRELADRGFDTAVRLPWTPKRGDQESWLHQVRVGLDDLTDQILLLLGTFDAIDVDDRIAPSHQTITPTPSDKSDLATGTTRERVVVARDDEETSSWLVYRHKAGNDLAGETTVAVRLVSKSDDAASDVAHPITGSVPTGAPMDDISPFHLFFPTSIGAGLPLLLHGYFEVDAARTGFYEGSAEHNDAILVELAELTVRAVADVAASGSVDPVTLVDLIAAARTPEDPHARDFRDAVLDGLDTVPWIPLAKGGSPPRLAAPPQVLVGDPTADRALAATFPVPYIERRSSRRVPDPRLSDLSFRFLAQRQEPDADTTWDVLEELLRPSDESPWLPGTEDDGFLKLVDLVQVLDGVNTWKTQTLLKLLRGNPDSKLIPVPTQGDGRRLVPIPDPGSAGSRNRGTLVMARIRRAGEEPLDPPPQLNVAFLPDGLLTEDQLDRAHPLGIRPFTVDNILDRLNALVTPTSADTDHENYDRPTTAAGSQGAENVTAPNGHVQMVTFLWNLLTRERRSEYGTGSGAIRAAQFRPNQWFWLQPGRGEHNDSERDRQARERYLSSVQLPARDGTWRRAGRLAMGSDWADWLEQNCRLTDDMRQRARALRALEHTAPDAASLLAPPSVLLRLLPAGAIPFEDDETDDDSPGGLSLSQDVDVDERSGASPHDESELPVDAANTQQNTLERLAFLLRLGVWEVPPVEAFERRQPREPKGWPWAVERADLDREIDAQPWDFESQRWSGPSHQNIYVSEDFRLAWPLETHTSDAASALVRALAFGAPLYAKLGWATAFCPGCRSGGGSHKQTYRTEPDSRRPSTLALQLQRSAWVPGRRRGRSVGTLKPTEVWWVAQPPPQSALHTSPLWHLTMAEPDLTWPEPIRRLAGLIELAKADQTRLIDLLDDLRKMLDEDALTGSADGSASRQAFIGLHRHIYERLAELAEASVPPPETIPILCELGNQLGYNPPDQARHDDGRFAPYRRWFAGKVPFAVIPRDKRSVARQLGVPALDVRLLRRDTSDGIDVTDDLATVLGDRIPELLAILVHHSLGTQTLDPTSDTFTERAQRLQQLRVRRLPDLVIEAEAIGTGIQVTLGEGSQQECLLEGANTRTPVLFHDLAGPEWQRRIRRLLPAHLAAIVENAAYAATFTLLLIAETDAEREDVLQGVGVGQPEIDAIRARIGAVSQADRVRYRRWFAAILESCTGQPVDPDSIDLDPAALSRRLVDAGLEADSATAVAAAGGVEAIRSETEPGSVPWHLDSTGIELRELDAILLRMGEHGLDIRVANTRFKAWRARHGQRLTATLVPRLSANDAKTAVARCAVPESLAFSLDPDPEAIVEPFAALLRSVGYKPNRVKLAHDPISELTRLASLSETELNEQAAQLYDDHERARRLATLARAWRSQLVLLGLLDRSAPGETRAAIRAHAEAVEGLCPHANQPSTLLDSLSVILPNQPGLRADLALRLVDSIPGNLPDRDTVLNLASRHGLRTDHADVVLKALAVPRREEALQLRRRAKRLSDAGVQITTPANLAPRPYKRPRATTAAGRRNVPAIKVTPGSDRRKRELGDEAEHWALASAVGALVALDHEHRSRAIESIMLFLKNFEGKAVDDVRAHGESVREADIDEEDLIDELSAFLHVARHSDRFGFDMLAWLPVEPGAEPRTLAVEVKSSSDGTFLMSRREWEVAESLTATDTAMSSYAVLVVRRGTSAGEPPTTMDLLPDPVALLADGHLGRDYETYRVTYSTSP